MCKGHYDRWRRGVRGQALQKPVRPYCMGPIDAQAATQDPTPEAPVSTQVKHDQEVAYLRAQLDLMRKKYSESIKQANATEQILEYNRLAVNALPAVPIPTAPRIHKDKTLESAVLLFGDTHIGETIKSEEMGGLNAYNFEVFCSRYQYLVDKTISYTTGNMSSYVFDSLYVNCLGDMVSGSIHDLEETNQLNIVEQATLGALVTAQGLAELARAFPKVIVSCVSGNHGRIKRKPYYKGKQQINWDYIFYQNLALLLQKQRNIEFRVPLSPWLGLEVQGWRFLILHGDNIRSWGSIPFYGINRAAARWLEIEAIRQNFFQYFIIGHFHSKGILQNATGEKIINGSLVGGSEFGVAEAGFADPVQLLFGMHKRYGKTWELTLNTKYATGAVRYQYDRTRALSDQIGKVA